jgi:hypothetical protein
MEMLLNYKKDLKLIDFKFFIKYENMGSKWICDNCGGLEFVTELIYMNKFSETKDSNMVYCKNCLEYEDLKCEKCKENIQAYICDCFEDYRYICFKCKCKNCN